MSSEVSGQTWMGSVNGESTLFNLVELFFRFFSCELERVH